jgi:hypothetical protein
MNSNICGVQNIPRGGAVTFPGISETPSQYLGEGIQYDGKDTFTVMVAGLYSLTCILSLDKTNQGDNTFYIELNGNTPVAGTANLSQNGQIVLTRVGYFDKGTTLRFINASSHSVQLAPAPTNSCSTGHFSMFRIADGGVGNIQTLSNATQSALN